MKGRFAAVGALAMLSIPLVACGSTQTTVVKHITTTLGATGATGSSGTTSRASPTAAVRDYYHLINAGRFDRAWAGLTPKLRGDLGGYYRWRNGYKFTQRTRVLDAYVLRQGGETATVKVRFAGDAKDACGRNVTQTFTGTWSLVAAGEKWIATRALASQVSGPGITRNASNCRSGGNGYPASPSPNYSPPTYTSPQTPSYTPPGANIPNYENGNGYRVQCEDGTYSQSGGIQGACSYHGGVAGDP